MVNEQLIRYIRDSIKRGYSFQQMKYYLLKNGWPSYVVDESINQVYKESVKEQYEQTKRPKNISREILAIAIFIFSVVVVLTGIFTLWSPGNVDASVTADIGYQIKISDTEFQAGEYIQFNNIFKNLPQGYMIYPVYKIYDKDTNAPVLRWEEEGGVSDGEMIKYKLSSSLEPGQYYIEGKANHQGRSISARADFSVYRDSDDPSCTDGKLNQGEEDIDCGGPCKDCPTCTDGKLNQGEEDIDCGGPCVPCDRKCKDCNDYNICTEDSCSEGKCVNEPIFPCCGNFLCEDNEDPNTCPADCEVASDKPVEYMTREEILEKARILIGSSTKEAGDFCDSVDISKVRDDCFRVIAYDSDNHILCNYINSTTKKDACYMEFAMHYDYSVCNKIDDLYLKKSCEALKMRPNPE